MIAERDIVAAVDARAPLLGEVMRFVHAHPELGHEEHECSRYLCETLGSAGWSPNDVTWVMPHNVSVRSWEILLGLTGIPRERLWSRNVARIGHTLAGDNFINLRDAMDDGSVCPGDRLLLFSYGYGAHWTALAVEA